MMRLIAGCFWVALAAVSAMDGQSLADRSAVTLSVGGETALGSPFGLRSGPAVSADYEFRIGKYLSIDGGEETWFPGGRSAGMAAILSGVNLQTYFNTTGSSSFASVPTRFVSTAVHGTVRGILPVSNDRVEFFVGIGPGYVWNLERSPVPSGVVFDFEAGGRVAIDKRRRFWVGAGSQFFANFRHDEQQWLATTASFTFRFGR